MDGVVDQERLLWVPRGSMEGNWECLVLHTDSLCYWTATSTIRNDLTHMVLLGMMLLEENS